MCKWTVVDVCSVLSHFSVSLRARTYFIQKKGLARYGLEMYIYMYMVSLFIRCTCV